MATRQSNNYGFTLQDNDEFVDIETTAANFEIVDTELKKVSEKAVINASDISSLEAAAAKLEKDIAALKASQESGGTVSAETAAKITALESQLTTVNANITNLKTRVSTLEGKMTTAEGDIDTLESDMDAAESDIDNLESKMTSAEGDIDALETDMDSAEKDIDNLEAEVESMKSQQSLGDWETLWSHDDGSRGKVMTSSETVYLSKKISELKFGLELIFTFTGGTYFTFFISKQSILTINDNDGVADEYIQFPFISPSLSKPGEKLLYFSGNRIVGHANNSTTHSIGNMTFYSGDFTLYAVNGL